jgi:hypothetical protein
MQGIALCLAVEHDRNLQGAIRTAADCEGVGPLYVMPSPSRAWLLLEGNRPARLGEDVRDGIRRFAINELEPSHDLWGDIFSSITRVGANEKAWKILAPIFNADASPTAAQMVKLMNWAPVLEVFAYQCFVTATMLVDGIRRRLLTEPLSDTDRDRTLIDYWTTLHTMGHLLALASSPSARPWLAKLGSAFPWRDWTPSFVLSRERTLWLMAAAAKSAVAFGESVIDRYLRKLSRSDHPLKSFDALLGLVAIGLDQPGAANSITTSIEVIAASRLDHPSWANLLDPMFRSAIETLSEPLVSEKRFERYARDAGGTKLSHPKLLGLDGLRLDSTELTQDGRVLGLIALPSIARSQVPEIYPRQANSLLLRPRDISLILERAWAAASPEAGRRVLH